MAAKISWYTIYLCKHKLELLHSREHSSSAPAVKPMALTQALTSLEKTSWLSRGVTGVQDCFLNPFSPDAGVCCQWSSAARDDPHCSLHAGGLDYHCSPGEGGRQRWKLPPTDTCAQTNSTTTINQGCFVRQFTLQVNNPFILYIQLIVPGIQYNVFLMQTSMLDGNWVYTCTCSALGPTG